MSRLSRYLLKLFTLDAVAILGTAVSLLYLFQVLRNLQLVTERGQSIFALLGHSALATATTVSIIIPVCLGIGIGRGLRGLQDRSELQVIHVSKLTGALMRAVLLYTIGGALVVVTFTNLIEPRSWRAINEWSASIAADLVSRTMIPERFTGISDAVTFRIGSRDAQGNITDFFGDDTRDPLKQKTYFADRAVIILDDQGYLVRLFDGTLHQLGPDGVLSEIAFSRYDLSLDGLNVPIGGGTSASATTTLDMLSQAETAGGLTPSQLDTIVRRVTEGLRVFSICLSAAAIASFPTGRRRRFAPPMELSVLLIVFLERVVFGYVPIAEPWRVAAGPIFIALFSLLILALRLRLFVPLRLPRAA